MEQCSHPARCLFDDTTGPGIISRIVDEQWRRDPGALEPPPEVLKDIWRPFKCFNVLRLIDRIRKQRIIKIGSGSIDLDRATERNSSWKNAARFQHLYIGNPRKGISPLRWLLFLARGFDAVPITLRPTFNNIIGNLLLEVEDSVPLAENL